MQWQSESCQHKVDCERRVRKLLYVPLRVEVEREAPHFSTGRRLISYRNIARKIGNDEKRTRNSNVPDQIKSKRQLLSIWAKSESVLSSQEWWFVRIGCVPTMMVSLNEQGAMRTKAIHLCRVPWMLISEGVERPGVINSFLRVSVIRGTSIPDCGLSRWKEIREVKWQILVLFGNRGRFFSKAGRKQRGWIERRREAAVCNKASERRRTIMGGEKEWGMWRREKEYERQVPGEFSYMLEEARIT